MTTVQEDTGTVDKVHYFKNDEGKRLKSHMVGYGQDAIFTGNDYYETDPNLEFPQSMEVYDDMTRNESRIQMVMNAIRVSFATMQFYFDGEDGYEKDYIEKAFERIGFAGGLKGLITKIVDAYKYGFSCFEKVWSYNSETDNVDLTLYHVYQRTIDLIYYKWDFNKSDILARVPDDVRVSVDWNDKVSFIQQTSNAGDYTYVPGTKLSFFTVNEENGLVTGRSVLRSIYRDYYDKLILRELNIKSRQKTLFNDIAFILGTQAPDNDARARISNFIKGRERYRSAGILLPPDTRVQTVSSGDDGSKGNTISEDMKYYDTSMLESLFLNFLQMGSQKGTSGNRSLSDNITQLFSNGVYALADNICSYINSEFVTEMVERNFGKGAIVPKLVVDRQDRKDVGYITELIKSGAITPDYELEKHVRAGLGLPVSDEGSGVKVDDVKDKDDKDNPNKMTSNVTDATAFQADKLNRIENKAIKESGFNQKEYTKFLNEKTTKVYTSFDELQDKWYKKSLITLGRDPNKASMEHSYAIPKEVMKEIDETIDYTERKYTTELRRIGVKVESAKVDKEVKTSITNRFKIGVLLAMGKNHAMVYEAMASGITGSELDKYYSSKIKNNNTWRNSSNIISHAFGKVRTALSEKNKEGDFVEVYSVVLDDNLCKNCRDTLALQRRGKGWHEIGDKNFKQQNPNCLGRLSCRCVNIQIKREVAREYELR